MGKGESKMRLVNCNKCGELVSTDSDHECNKAKELEKYIADYAGMGLIDGKVALHLTEKLIDLQSQLEGKRLVDAELVCTLCEKQIKNTESYVVSMRHKDIPGYSHFSCEVESNIKYRESMRSE